MQQRAGRRWGINGFTLKWIALLTMLIDHTGMALFPQYTWMRIIGRLAFPIYCFLLVEGSVYTSNKKKYLGRLFLFALISEVPFDLVRTGTCFDWKAQNVFFTLFVGLVVVTVLQMQINKAYSVCITVALILAAEYMKMDYGGGGVFMILLFFVFRKRLLAMSASFAAATFCIYGGIQNYAILSLIPVLCYNGKRGPRIKYLFYVFYPVHLIVLYWLKFRT